MDNNELFRRYEALGILCDFEQLEVSNWIYKRFRYEYFTPFQNSWLYPNRFRFDSDWNWFMLAYKKFTEIYSLLLNSTGDICFFSIDCVSEIDNSIKQVDIEQSFTKLTHLLRYATQNIDEKTLSEPMKTKFIKIKSILNN